MHSAESRGEFNDYPSADLIVSAQAHIPMLEKDMVLPPLNIDQTIKQKILFMHTPSREDPARPYSQKDVALRLRSPAGYAIGAPVNPMPAARRQREPIYQPESSTTEYFPGPPELREKLYKGPIYLQGNEPTCGSWALIHAMNVVGIKPDAALATELLNESLPNGTSPKGGMTTFQAAAIVQNAADPELVHTLGHELGNGRVTPARLAGFLKKTLDQRGAVIANISPVEQEPHAVCISGYRLDSNNYMDIQYIDSNDGEHFMAVESFTAWANKSECLYPSLQFSIIGRKSDGHGTPRRHALEGFLGNFVQII